MCGNRTAWLKEAASAGNQLFVASVNPVKALYLHFTQPTKSLTLHALPFLQPTGEVSFVTVSVLPTKKLGSKLVSYLPWLTGKR